MHQAARRKPDRPEKDHRLYLHRQALAQHGEPAGHPGGGQLSADPPGARLLQSVPHLRGTKETFYPSLQASSIYFQFFILVH